MNAKVTWNREMSFTGTAESGFKVPLGSGALGAGGDDGFRPLELMAVSLAGCTAMDVFSILEKKQQAVTAFEVRVQTDRADQHPKVFTHAVITYLVTGHAVDESAVVRAIELSATKYCPAQAMLGQLFPIELVYEIYEQESGGRLVPVKQGEYKPQTGQGSMG